MNWGVRTMQSVKSCFNSALFRKNLTRFWPIWGLYSLAILTLPGGLFLMANSNIYSGTDGRLFAVMEFAENIVPTFSAYTAVPLACIFGIMAAMATFSYLFSSRSAGLMHTLPLRREGLFLTSYLSGLCYFLIPLVAVFLITLLGEAIAGYVNIGTLAVWLLTQVLCTLFFYSLGVFCAMFTGHLLALPMFYLLSNVLAMIVYGIASLIARQTLYGFSGLPDGMLTVALWLTPASKLSGELTRLARAESPGNYGLGCAALYAVVGVVLTVLALLVYRRRHVERAGDIVAVGWVRPIFRYGFATVFACIFGSLLYSIFDVAALANDAMLLLFLVVCGVIGYFLAEMLLQKSFRVFRRWKGCAVFSACMVVGVCLLLFDAAGYETRVPTQETVESVTFFAASSAPYDSAQGKECTVDDPETVAMILRLHQSLLEQRDSLEARDAYGTADDELYYTSPSFSYTLSDGSVLRRSYPGLALSQSDLDAPDSPASQVLALLNQPDVVSYMYGATIGGEYTPVTEIPAGKVSAIDLCVYADANEAYITLECPVGADRERLWNAILADFAEGTLGRRYLSWSDSEWFKQIYAELTVTFTPEYNEYGWSEQPYITIALTPNAVHTISLLEELGLLDGDSLRGTYADGYVYNQ